MPIHAPIYGSQFNPPAKLYKRLTNDIPVRIDADKIVQIEFNGRSVKVANDGIITVQNNRYVFVDTFRWALAMDRQEEEYQPINGLLVQNGHMTIKFNSAYQTKANDLREPRVGDILSIGGELWIIESPIQRIRHRSLRNLATVILPLSSVGIA